MKGPSDADGECERHSILLVGPNSSRCLLQLTETLASDDGPSCWSVDWSAGVLSGDVLLDGRSSRIEVTSLAGREPYEAMHDSTYAESDAVLCVMADSFKKDLADRVFEHVELVKDGKKFWMSLVMVGADPSCTPFLKAQEWAASHECSTALTVKDDHGIADVLCQIATRIHREKALRPAMPRHINGGMAPVSCMGPPRWKSKGKARHAGGEQCSIM